ncbi:MAG TPA: hypothetical protein VFV54_07345 [Thermoanaerobaculia bacterium]|nr:hypothetical protein [Thermoanaerobaculia bacterium]
MRKILFTLFLLALSLPPRLATAQTIRIGIFDSRAVALAFYNSAEGRKERESFFAQHRSARDQKRAAELEALGAARQQLMHQQVFSNGSILNLNGALRGAFESVAKETGVALIVSKWEVAWRDPAVEYLDVTDALVDRLQPDANVRGMMSSVKAQEPLPLAEALAIRD